MCNPPAVVPPFFDLETGPPPPFSPMLMDQLELFGHVDHRLITLIADEVLVPKASSIIHAASSSMPAPEFKLAKWVPKKFDHSSSPYLKKATFSYSHSHSCSHSQMPLLSDSVGSLDSLSDSDSSTSYLSEDSKIPKPAGEPGHPGCGGYTLYEALDWNLKIYTKFKVH
ncbi:hypothetical protein BDR04DRAFT_1155511 [Suillus decipiens]|nr:hypothetical protein BDR04DRAFT_1155511 [Suillus decipiens]